MKNNTTWGGEREGAGRPSVYQGKKQVKLYLTEAAVNVLQQRRRITGQSMSDIASTMIENFKEAE